MTKIYFKVSRSNIPKSRMHLKDVNTCLNSEVTLDSIRICATFLDVNWPIDFNILFLTVLKLLPSQLL